MFKLNLSSPHMSITISKNREAKGTCQSKWIVTGQPSSIGVFPIVREAFKICMKNKAIVVSILLPVFLLFSALTYGADLASEPFEMISNAVDMNKDFIDNGFNERSRRVILSDLRNYTQVEFVKWLMSLVIWVFFFVTSVTLSSEAYAGNKVKARDVVSKIGRWKRLVITSFYMNLIYIGLMVLFLAFIGLIYMAVEGSALVCLITAAVVAGVFCQLYVSAIWMMSLVVSVLEDGSYGIKAIDRAGELMKGKRVHGCALKLLMILASGAIYVTVFVTMFTTVEELNFLETAQAMVFPRIFFACVMQFFGFVMFTVFYHERKASCEEGGEKGEVGSYVSIDCADQA